MRDYAVKQADRSVLARMIAAHARPALTPKDVSPVAERGFVRALRHASLPFDGLGLEVTEVKLATAQALGTCLDSLPPHGLLALLEDGQGRRGLMALSHGLVDALIEVQTTGHVEQTALPPRAVTRIDEALTRDYSDLFLSALARETEEVEGRDWPHRMAFGSTLADRDRLTLLMPEQDHVLFSAELAFKGTARTAALRLILPVDPALARSRKAPDRGDATRLKAWQAGMARALAAAPLSLDAVLLRVTRPLGEVMGLEVGDLVPFSASDLATVTLENNRGDAMLRGRLGQIGGKRAVRLPGADAPAAETGPLRAAEPATQTAPLPEMPPRSGQNGPQGEANTTDDPPGPPAVPATAR